MLEEEIRTRLIKSLGNTRADVYKEFVTYGTVADLAVLTDKKFRGYEIKSDADSLKRFIELQKLGYLYFFDECTLVVGGKLLDKARKLLEEPDSQFNNGVCPWGLMNLDFEVLIKPKLNTSWPRNDLFLLGRLWKADCVIEARKRAVAKVSKKSAPDLRQELLAIVKPEEVRPLVRKYTKLHKEYQESGSRLLYSQWIGKKKWKEKND